jgi:two-component system sensor histidine kinase CpxA
VLEREEVGPDQVRVQIPPGLEVRAEPELLERAVGNLVRNALRYAGGSGPIEITAERTHHEVILRIGDSGPGVPEESLPKLFEPFYRPDASRTRESGGTGLGLAIVKTCIEACGGSVTARLREPTGLEVALRLAAVEGE